MKEAIVTFLGSENTKRCLKVLGTQLSYSFLHKSPLTASQER